MDICNLYRLLYKRVPIRKPSEIRETKFPGRQFVGSFDQRLLHVHAQFHACRARRIRSNGEMTRPGQLSQKTNWKDPPFSMGKSTISMVIFNSYVTNYQRGKPRGFLCRSHGERDNQWFMCHGFHHGNPCELHSESGFWRQISWNMNFNLALLYTYIHYTYITLHCTTLHIALRCVAFALFALHCITHTYIYVYVYVSVYVYVYVYVYICICIYIY